MAKELPFLHIVTRTCKRPGLLMLNQKSLAMQNGKDFVQQIIEDKTGKGVPAANAKLRGIKARGRYVWVFDDDNVIMVGDFIYELGLIVAREDPEVIVVCCNHPSNQILPSVWPPVEGKIDAINVVVRADVWEEKRQFWGDHYAGDWDFINSLDIMNRKYSKMPGVPLAIPRVSRGLSEAEYGIGYRGPHVGTLRVGHRVRILTSLSGADFSYAPEQEVEVSERNITHLSSLIGAKLAEATVQKKTE